MIKVIELFAGIGSQRKALENIEINYKIVAICDNDKYAEKSYRAIFNDYDTPNLGDITKLETLPYADLITWSFLCQDISNAKNKGQGLNGKRSGLAYKVVDLIKTMPIKPQYLLMENVPNLLSKKFFVGFQNLQNQLNKLRYHNQYFTMNAKDCGIPQNRKRLFMISTLKQDFKFQYPQPCNLKFLVKDILENNVNEKYFIRQESMKKAIENNKLKIIQQCAYTITTKQMRWGNAGIIAIPTIKDYGNFIVLPRAKDGLLINGSYNRFWKTENNYMGTIAASNVNKIMIDNKIQNQYTNKILSFLIDEKEYFLRILTPCECWLLMGFSNKDFDKANKVVSETQLYKQAGNSIVIDVLEKIFIKMFKTEKKN
ncbi:DNA cytosine methyltransferase [Spiroplasma phoeniceum]|uniref:DNA (cytosine-5-)-methyltransferase n=1 Tax=Spiroplasma phoeniceum P40 TaxID=1276259 RepID=A0A345DMM3_9MOLU|nr:DNA (cytosine-5-)-methyltransferase [Spiroplasma phoeniceum]AXF95461.1 deoxycytosine methylase [Spiroplasma phoeniceum P40]